MNIKIVYFRNKVIKQIPFSSLIIASIAIFIAGCDNSTEDEKYNPTINPVDFVTKIDNKYFPLVPGTTFIYQGKVEGGIEKNEVYVTHNTKTIIGVTCVVVDDKVWVNNELVEATLDWYAQDKDGNVWYFGEDSKEYEKGAVVSTSGSWETDVNGAKPGIIMYANPEVGKSYRQEYYKNEAEDMAMVLSLKESVTVNYGSFNNCLMIKEWTPLDSDVIENKYYSQGIGNILSVMVKGGTDKSELIEIKNE